MKACDGMEALELLKGLRDSAHREIKIIQVSIQHKFNRLQELEKIILSYNSLIDESTDNVIMKNQDGNTNTNK